MPGAEPCPDDQIDLRDYMDGLFHGHAAHLGERFAITPDSDKGRSCSDLTDPASLKQLLDFYAQTSFPADDARSSVSYWSQWYFGLLLPPLILLAGAARSQLPASLANLRLALDASGQPQGFELTDPYVAPALDADTPFDRLAPLIDGHLSPLVFSLSARSGVSAKVFWMNAAVVIDYTHEVLWSGSQDIDLKAITGSPKKPDGNRNPLFSPYRPSGSEATRTRRVCCLRYGLEGVARCQDCSLKPTYGNDRRPLVLGASK